MRRARRFALSHRCLSSLYLRCAAAAINAVLAALRDMRPATSSTTSSLTTAPTSDADERSGVPDDNEPCASTVVVTFVIVVIVIDRSYARLLLFAAPFVARVEVASQLGAIVKSVRSLFSLLPRLTIVVPPSTPPALLEVGLRAFGVERLAAMGTRRYAVVKTTLAMFLVRFLVSQSVCRSDKCTAAGRHSSLRDDARCFARHSRLFCVCFALNALVLTVLARAIDVGVRISILDYIGAARIRWSLRHRHTSRPLAAGVQSMFESLEALPKVPSLLLKSLLLVVDVYPTFKNLVRRA